MKLTYFKFIIYLFFSVFGVLETSAQYRKQTSEQISYVYRDLGNYNVKYSDGSSIGIHAYIIKGKNTNTFFHQYSNQFILVAESTSVHRGQYTETWLYGTKVFLDGNEVTALQHPDGFTAYIKTSETVVYTWYTNDNDIGKYNMTWESSAYVIK